MQEYGPSFNVGCRGHYVTMMERSYKYKRCKEVVKKIVGDMKAKDISVVLDGWSPHHHSYIG